MTYLTWVIAVLCTLSVVCNLMDRFSSMPTLRARIINAIVNLGLGVWAVALLAGQR